MEYEPDDNYPTDQLCTPYGQKLKFKRITSSFLYAACCVGFTGASTSNWTFVMLQSYFKMEGLNNAII